MTQQQDCDDPECTHIIGENTCRKTDGTIVRHDTLNAAIEAAAEALAAWNTQHYGHRTDADACARLAVEAAAPHLIERPLDAWRTVRDNLGEALLRAERAEAELEMRFRSVVHRCCEDVQSERALADQLAEALRDLARPGVNPYGDRIAKANAALAAWEEARRG